MYKDIAANKRNSVLLVLIFVIIIAAIGYIVGLYYNGNAIGSAYPYGPVAIAMVISLGFTMFSYFQGDKVALWSSGAKPLLKEQNGYVYNMVENLCITAGTPVPKIYLIEDAAINAFATGRNPEKASIALTRGAVEKLENEELEGVIAHELSHVKNFDIRFMMLVMVLVGTISIMADMFLRSRLFGFGGRRDNDRGGNPILLIIGLVLIVLSPIIAELIKLAISRKREFLADASGALLTRYPEGLARALEKIALENRPLAKSSTATAHLFIASPFSGKGLKNMFSTHPPVEERVKRLRAMGR